MKKHRTKKYRLARASARRRTKWQHAHAVVLASARAYAQETRCAPAAALATVLRAMHAMVVTGAVVSANMALPA